MQAGLGQDLVTPRQSRWIPAFAGMTKVSTPHLTRRTLRVAETGVLTREARLV